MSDTLAYKILRAESHSTDDRKGAMDAAAVKLEKLVLSHLSQGWEPQGGITAEHMLPLHIYAYAQAMVLKEPGSH